MADRKRTRRVSFAAEEEDEDERKGRDAAQRRLAKNADEDVEVSTREEELILPPLGEWEADACKAITLRLVDSPDDVSQSTGSFHPAFAHQIFGDEEGYKNLGINVWYTPASFFTYGSMACSERRDNADDVVKTLSEFMTLDTRSLPAFIAALSQPFTPPGKLVASAGDLAVYATQPATDATAAAYHSRLQVFTLWFVDGARYIELDDPRWNVYYLFQCTNTPQAYRLLGFITTYSFYAYHRAESDHSRVRVSQVLIFPPYQRHGHGRFLYNAICDRARQDPRVQDITVEDPNADFSRLRDLCDLHAALKHPFFQRKPLGPPPSDKTLTDIQRTLKLSKLQLKRVYEVLRYREATEADGNAQKAVRLLIKRRLYATHNLRRKGRTMSPLEQEAHALAVKTDLRKLFASVAADYQELINRLK